VLAGGRHDPVEVHVEPGIRGPELLVAERLGEAEGDLVDLVRLELVLPLEIGLIALVELADPCRGALDGDLGRLVLREAATISATSRCRFSERTSGTDGENMSEVEPPKWTVPRMRMDGFVSGAAGAC
jgi:hypothetical protein